ncbi:MAG: GNAT family N-acetyltransferase [Roseiflexaceae bacterium]|jgi:ribosomal protein S18 acetylase RimI-like enzyme|nr:GNAT family N-acetyltransferase [Chloroflexaceae bacterium]MCE2852531.1 GNAT family N-acetyltransferase [Chloroflexaceae bacterium]
MLAFHPLTQTSIETIHPAFIDAFSAYEVPMELPLERLQSMMYIRNYVTELSLGCFVDEQLVGFVLVGARRDRNGILRTYDVATGVVRAFQNQKIGSQLLTHLIPMLTRAGAASFQLEVLEHNVAAQKLYTRHGFTQTRKFHCYQSTSMPTATEVVWATWGTDPTLLATVAEATYVSFVPSWQYALASYQRTATTCHVITAHDGANLVAYGIIEGASIMQIGILPAYRTPELLTGVLARLAHASAQTHLRIINVEAACWLDLQLVGMGWEHMISQYEMVKLFTTPH